MTNATPDRAGVRRGLRQLPAGSVQRGPQDWLTWQVAGGGHADELHAPPGQLVHAQ